MYVIILLFVVTFLLTFIFLRGRYNENYWRKRGIPFHNRNKVLGIFWEFITTDKALFEVLNELYKKYEGAPAVGLGALMTPNLFILDPQNIQHVLHSDFQSFSHRGIDINDGDKLADSILFMNGPRWKLMRQKMTPLFTAAKLKNMYYIIDKSAQDFVEHLKENPQKLKGNGYETINEFCCAAVAAAVFGIGTGSTFKSPFLQMARDAVKVNWRTNIRFAILGISPTLSKILGLKLFKEQEEFFIGAVKKVFRAREKETGRKHDFAEICLNLQSAGTMKDQETGQELEPTDELLAAQGFFFFVAGVEPAATAMFGALTELGKSPEILKKVQQEIDATMEKHNGQMNYEIISEMKYLDQVLSEALRLHAPIGFLSRRCINDSVLPVGNVKVSKGTDIIVPVYNMHFDPKYFPDPEVFDPERFGPEKRKQRDLAYMPFGKGGRICIGMRYSKLQILTGLLYLLRNYDVVSHLKNNSRKYAKTQFQVRRVDYDIELIPRNL